MSYSRPNYGANVQQRIINAPAGKQTVVPFVPLTEIQRAIDLHRQGRLGEAEAIYLHVLGKLPAQFECLHFLGLLRHQQGRSDEALSFIKRAIEVNGNDPSVHCNLGLVLHATGRLDEALASYERAIGMHPEFALAYGNRGNVLRDLGQTAAAIDSYERACVLAPDFVDAHAHCARLLQAAGRYAEALKHYEKLIALAPSADLHHARGCMQRLLFQHEAALASFNEAIRLDATHVDAWCNKASTHYILGQQQAVDEAFKNCLQIKPDSADVRLKRMMLRIPAVRDPGDDVDGIRKTFSSELAAFGTWVAEQQDIDPLEVVGAAQPFYLAYQERSNRDLLVPYGRICHDLMTRLSTTLGIAPEPARRGGASKLRVGIVSAHFINHPVWNAIVKGWFKALDRNRFELHAFDLGAVEDAQTAIVKSSATAYHRDVGSVLDWAKRIVTSELDVLIYPELGMDQTTAQLAAMRLARRQVATWGHPETTGLPTIDVYLSAEAFETPDAQAHYSERLVRLPNLGCHYDAPSVVSAPFDLAAHGIRPEAPLFICAGSPFKYAPEYDHVFVEIARRMPDAQFLFFSNPRLPGLSAKFQQRIASAFNAAGLDPAHHLRVLPWQSPQVFYGIMKQAHVFLDTIGFSGFNTAMQAIDCALPIVTMEGQFMRGRFASAILKRIGLDEFVHGETGSYIESACRLASDGSCREAVREQIIARRAVLYGDAAPVRALEAVLEKLCSDS